MTLPAAVWGCRWQLGVPPIGARAVVSEFTLWSFSPSDGGPAEAPRGAEGELNQEMGALGNKLGSFLVCASSPPAGQRAWGKGRGSSPGEAVGGPWFVLDPSGPFRVRGLPWAAGSFSQGCSEVRRVAHLSPSSGCGVLCRDNSRPRALESSLVLDRSSHCRASFLRH